MQNSIDRRIAEVIDLDQTRPDATVTRVPLGSRVAANDAILYNRAMVGALDGIRILDLARVYAAPSCTQMLGDLGADVIKVEQPGAGDESRHWGPPYVEDAEGGDTRLTAYYLAANRNKRSITVDITSTDGQALIRRLAAESDVLVENFKFGSMAKYGLSYDDLKDDFPGLVYLSVSGFGQTGPAATRPGYDFVMQGVGGMMSITGETDGQPLRTAVAVVDYAAGLHGAIAVLSALRHRDATGEGQYIDLGLYDVQVSMLMNHALIYLMNGEMPGRWGNAVALVVPYQSFPSKDGHFNLAIANDGQFRRFCGFVGRDDLAGDARYATNRARVANRETLIPIMEDILRQQTSAYWLENLETVNVPSAPILDIPTVLDDPHTKSREMVIEMPHPAAGGKPVRTLANPAKLSKTPLSYRRPPPEIGAHTDEVLREVLGMGGDEIAALRAGGIL